MGIGGGDVGGGGRREETEKGTVIILEKVIILFIYFLKKPNSKTADGYLWHLSTYLTAEHHQVLDGICSQNRSLVNCKHK